MKRFPFSSLLRTGFLLVSLAGTQGVAQELPGPTLLLPPPPATLAGTPALVAQHTISPGESKAGNSKSQLTLPAKPEVKELAMLNSAGPENLIPPVEPETTPIPEEIPLSLENPLLPPVAPGTPGGFDLPSEEPAIQPVPADTAPANPKTEPETEADSEAKPDTVPSSDLSPVPQKSTEADADGRGPLFRIRGAEAYALARQQGFRFTPANGIGYRDGNHTVASQVPNVLTSEVHGTRMMQMRPSPLWTTAYIENTFYMFCDGNYNAVRLNPGWKVRGIQLKGSDWQWVVCPRSGANTASFSIKIRSWKNITTPAQGTVVTLHGLTLEGPPGATNWKAAFPDLKRQPAMAVKR